MALTKIGATLGGSADIITVTQTGHGLLVGRPVRMTDVSGTPTYAYATAAGTATADAIGIIIAKTTDTLTIALGGRITVDDCVPTGDAGTVLFLQVAAGLLAATEPSGNTEVSKPMAVITIDGSEMIMVQQRGEVISTAGISIADGSIDNDAMADNAIDTDEIAADAVTNAKLADMATRTVKANATSGSANPTDVVMADGDFLIANASGLVTVPIAGDVDVSNTGAATLTPAAITGKTAKSSVAGADTILISDSAASGALKEMTRTNFVAGVGTPTNLWIPVYAMNSTTAEQVQHYDYAAYYMDATNTDTICVAGVFAAAPIAVKWIFMPTNASGSIVYTLTSDYASVGQTLQTHQDSTGNTTLPTTNNTLQALDVMISPNNFFGSAVAGDFFGMIFSRIGGNGSDNLNATLAVIGLLVEY